MVSRGKIPKRERRVGLLWHFHHRSSARGMALAACGPVTAFPAASPGAGRCGQPWGGRSPRAGYVPVPF